MKGLSPDEAPRTVDALVEAFAIATPDAVAVSGGGGERLTYRELYERATDLAEQLAARGVGPEVTVGLFLERSVGAVVAMLGTLIAGGAYVPLDPAYPRERLDYMLADADVRIAIASRQTNQELSKTGVSIIVIDDVGIAESVDRNPGYATVRARPAMSRAKIDGLAYVMYTSGSTGKPKGVAIVHRGIARLVNSSSELEATADDVFLQSASLAFDMSTYEIWAPLTRGGRLAIAPPGLSSLAELGARIRQHGVTTLTLTPAVFHLIIEMWPNELDFVRRVVVGGDVLSPSHAATFIERAPHCRLINGYGPTESTAFATVHTVTSASMQHGSIPIGRALPGTHAYVFDADGQIVEPEAFGELWLGGDGLARGYLKDPALTARSFVRHTVGRESVRLYRTGDRVRRLASGELDFGGRIDAQVKIRGFRVEPGEIECALREHAAVRDAAVVTEKSGQSERSLIAYVVLRDGRVATERDLRSYLETRLPAYARPSRIVARDAFLLTSSGKVDRGALSQPIERTSDGNRKTAASQLEERVARIFERLLGIDRLALDVNFFEVGGHSLLATRVVAELAREFDVAVSLRAFFGSPTVIGVARLVESSPAIERRPLASGCESGAANVAARLAGESDERIDEMLREALRRERGATAKRLRCVLTGTTSLLLQCGDLLLEAGHVIVALASTEPEARLWARERGIDAIERVAELKALLAGRSFDYLFSIVNAEILPVDVLALPERGAINYHDGPLPRYAGSHATTWAILAGEAQHGIVWHEMTPRVDAGAILQSRSFPIDADTSFTLNVKCYHAAIASFVELVEELANDSVVARPQDSSVRTFFPRSKRPSTGSAIDWNQSAVALDAFVRALNFGSEINPFGAATFRVDEMQYRCRAVHVVNETATALPGTVVRIDDDGPVVAVADRHVTLLDVRSDDGEHARYDLRPGVRLLPQCPQATHEKGPRAPGRATA